MALSRFLAMTWLPCALGLAACGPSRGLDDASGSGSATGSTTADEGSTSTDEGSTSSGSTAQVPDGSSSGEPIAPDMGGGVPSLCPEGAGDLEPLWAVTDFEVKPLDGVRTGPVATMGGMVAWVAGTESEVSLRVLDADGNPHWDEVVPTTTLDLAIASSGELFLAGAVSEKVPDALLRVYDASGGLLGEDVVSTAGEDRWMGLANAPSGGVLVGGQTDGVLAVRRYGADAVAVPGESFVDPGPEIALGLALGAEGTIVSACSIDTDEAVCAHAPDGASLWVQPLGEGSGLDVATDGQGRIRVVFTPLGDDVGSLELYEADGGPDHAIPLSYRPLHVVTDIDGSIIVAGTDGEQLVVERRDASGELVTRRNLEGVQLTGLAVDEQCHVYVASNHEFSLASLDKLQ